MTVPIQLRVDQKQIEHIKKLARLRAVEEDRDIDWQDLVREAIAKVFPLPVTEGVSNG